MSDNRLGRRKAPRREKTSYPDVGEIAQDRRRFLRLFGGLVLGTAAGLATAGAGASASPLWPPDDPPVPGGKAPSPEKDPMRPGGVAPRHIDLEDEPEEKNGEEKVGEEKDGNVKPGVEGPEKPPMPGEPPVILEQPEFELDGDVAAPADPPKSQD